MRDALDKSREDEGRWQRLSPWLFRIPAALLLTGVLVLQWGRVDQMGAAVMYTASWVVLLHVLIGEYVFVRHLHAVSRNQQVLDGFAGLLLLGSLLSFTQPALWCAFLAGAFGLAIAKYLLIERHLDIPALRRYVREKLWLESPSVCLLSGLAVLMNELPTDSLFLRILELLILIAATLFAVWMIGIRHLYRTVAKVSHRRHPQPS